MEKVLPERAPPEKAPTADSSVPSFIVPLDVQEDVTKELEDFIHLAHLGCMEEAEDIYYNVLKQYAPGSFPILAEYIELLLDNHKYYEVLGALEHIEENKFTQPEQQLLKLVEFLSACRLNEKIMWNQELACWSMVDFTLSDVLERSFKINVTDTTCSQRATRLEVRFLEVSLSLYVKANQALQRQEELVMFFSQLPSVSMDEVFHSHCLPLLQFKRFWEAYKILLVVTSWTGTSKARQYFEEFARHLSCHPPSRSKRVVELASGSVYLDILADAGPTAEEQLSTYVDAFFQTAITTENLLGVFFDGSIKGRGKHESRMKTAVAKWVPKNSIGRRRMTPRTHEVRQAFERVMDNVSVLPEGLRKMAEAIANHMNGEPQQRRRNLMVNACLECRKQQIRCHSDGSEPCSSCQRRGTPCTRLPRGRP